MSQMIRCEHVDMLDNQNMALSSLSVLMLLLLPKIHNGLEHEEESRTGTNSLKRDGIQQLCYIPKRNPAFLGMKY
jgi:hypothetical protein